MLFRLFSTPAQSRYPSSAQSPTWNPFLQKFGSPSSWQEQGHPSFAWCLPWHWQQNAGWSAEPQDLGGWPAGVRPRPALHGQLAAGSFISQAM